MLSLGRLVDMTMLLAGRKRLRDLGSETPIPPPTPFRKSPRDHVHGRFCLGGIYIQVLYVVLRF